MRRIEQLAMAHVRHYQVRMGHEFLVAEAFPEEVGAPMHRGGRQAREFVLGDDRAVLVAEEELFGAHVLVPFHYAELGRGLAMQGRLRCRHIEVGTVW